MVICCVVDGCSNEQKNGSGLSFHWFPLSKPHILEKLVHVIHRSNWKPTKYSYLCSDHFKESCFTQISGRNGRTLKPGSLPTEFAAFPENLQKITLRKRKFTSEMVVYTINMKDQVSSGVYSVTGNLEWNIFFSVQIISMWLMIKNEILVNLIRNCRKCQQYKIFTYLFWVKKMLIIQEIE